MNNFEINNLRVAAPCQVEWDSMKGDDGRRFCHLCRLNVYNFAEMTSDEIRDLIIKNEGRVCARLYKRADGTVLTKDCPTGARAYRKRIVRLAGAALTAVLALFSFSFGQKTNEKSPDDAKIKIARTFARENVLKGTIVDENGAVIPGAEIKLFQDQIYLKSVFADAEGNFHVSSLTAETYALEARREGFETFKSGPIKIDEHEQVDIRLELSVGEFILGLIVESPEADFNPNELKLQTEITLRKPDKP